MATSPDIAATRQVVHGLEPHALFERATKRRGRWDRLADRRRWGERSRPTNGGWLRLDESTHQKVTRANLGEVVSQRCVPVGHWLPLRKPVVPEIVKDQSGIQLGGNERSGVVVGLPLGRHDG